MVIVGAITRLTESGLSIAEWKPLLGTLPPLNDAEWNRIFELYKQTPEFQKKNFWMELPEFKSIFFWEWFHRFLGRFIGIAYGAPLIYFWLRGKIPKGYKLKLLAPFILGGLQGAMGWYMVKSGLVDVPSVSHYRLAAHLILAFIIFCVMLWYGLALRSVDGAKPLIRSRPLLLHALFSLGFLSITIIWGAFTAGLDGGLVYNDSFPKMGHVWIPPEAQQSIIDTPAGVQFLHRWLAMSTVLVVWSLWFHAAMRKLTFPVLNALALFSLLQMGLGIATLLSGVSLPVAVLHQAGALTVLALHIIILQRFGFRKY